MTMARGGGLGARAGHTREEGDDSELARGGPSLLGICRKNCRTALGGRPRADKRTAGLTVFATTALQRRTDAEESIALGLDFRLSPTKLAPAMDIGLDTF